jgi:hypothetical protein
MSIENNIEKKNKKFYKNKLKITRSFVYIYVSIIYLIWANLNVCAFERPSSPVFKQ